MNTSRMTRITFATLTVAAALGLAAGFQAQQARDQGGPPRTGTAVLSGSVVTDEQTPQPIRRAAVTVVNTDASLTRTTYTNDAGRFSLTGLPAGRYTLAASKAPFLRASYGAKRYDLPGTPITLKDGSQMTDIALRLTPGGVLSGRITDENGEPAFGVSVRVLQMRMQFGERTFVPPSSTGSTSDTTDDRGMFRVFGLPPGEYAVSASPRVTSGEVRAMTEDEVRAVMQALQQQQAAAAAQSGQSGVGAINPAQAGAARPPAAPSPDTEKVTVAYAPVYYPGTTVARRGIDDHHRPGRGALGRGLPAAPGAHDDGGRHGGGAAGNRAAERAVDDDAQRVDARHGPRGPRSVGVPARHARAGRQVHLHGSRARAIHDLRARGAAACRRATVAAARPGGLGQVVNFQSRVVTGGDMSMAMPMMTGGDPNGPQYWASADVPVDGTPVSGVTLALQPGMTITGKVEFRSVMTRPGADFKTVQLSLRPVATSPGLRINLGMPTSQVDETGKFTIAGVTPGRYSINGNAPAPPGPAAAQPAWRLASAIVKGRDILDFPLDIGPSEDVTGALITFTDATQEINGSLQDASGRPAPDYTIVVFAADKAYWTPQSRRVRTIRPGTDGKFTVSGLPPGDYLMGAVVDVVPSEVNDPAFLEQVVGAAVKITLGLGERKTQDLRISGGL